MRIVYPEHFVWNHDFSLSIFLIRKDASTLLCNILFTLRNRWSVDVCCAQDWWLLCCWALHTYFNKSVRRIIPVRYVINFKVYNWQVVRIFHICEAPLTHTSATVIKLMAILTAASYVSSPHLVKNIGKLLTFVLTFVHSFMLMINDWKSVMACFNETARIYTTYH